MKKLICLALCLLLLAGCSAPTAKPTAETRLFTDDTGRVVEVPAEIGKVAVTGAMAQITVFALCPEKLAGIADAWNPGGAAMLAPEYAELPVLGQLYGGKGEMNVETLIASGAQLVIDVGESSDSVAGDMDALTAQTGIPFVHIDLAAASMGDTFRALGELLAVPEEAETLASYCEGVYSGACALAERVDKVSVLYLLGDEGLNVLAANSYHSDLLDLLADNAAVVDEPSSKGTGNETDMEQLLLWDPEVILFAPNSIYDTVANEAAWQSMQAIRSGRYYEVPADLYNWMGYPPCVQRCLGMLWLGALLYPDEVDYDLYISVSSFYELFYHTELSEAQFDALTAKALP